ncbi:hypothetical protein [Paracidovorax avenae]|uniref:hypothetical protein n=1 Tax=Paracidovorax avenae TaxID=80867 RepID=UPI001AD7F03E|nr:hypothetical protein [Paracidovorax avenae]
MTEKIKIDDFQQLESLPYAKIPIIINEFIIHLFNSVDLEKKLNKNEIVEIKKINQSILEFTEKNIGVTDLKRIRKDAWMLHDQSVEPKKSIIRIIIFGLYEEEFEEHDAEYIAFDIFNAIFFILKKLNSHYAQLFLDFIKNHRFIN